MLFPNKQTEDVWELNWTRFTGLETGCKPVLFYRAVRFTVKYQMIEQQQTFDVEVVYTQRPIIQACLIFKP